MSKHNVISSFLLIVGVSLFFYAGYEILFNLGGKSGIEMGYKDAASLKQVKPYVQNRFRYRITNQNATPAKIIGESAC